MKRTSRKTFLWGLVTVLALSVICHETANAGRGGGGGGRGGGGGGGGRGGGGGGGAHAGGGGGGIGGGGGGHAAASRPSMPASRPNAGSSPGFGGHSGGGSRPNTGQANIGSRPSTGAGTGLGNRPEIGSRPNIGSGAGAATRPSVGGNGNLRPGTGERPQIGTRPGTNDRPGIDGRPGVGNRPGVDSRPGMANRPGNTLPGMGNRFPNAGDRPNAGNRLPNGGANIQDRHNDLQGRLQNGGNWQNNHQDWRNQNREDWQNWASNNHGNWHHGYGSGGYWNHMWSEHPGWMAFGMTTWGVNRLAYGFGLWGYSNPYYAASGATSAVYDYSQPIIQQPTTSDGQAPATPDSPATPPAPSDTAVSSFDQARSDFYNGDYASALDNVNQTLKETPKDTVVHEFRSLVLFALGRYNEAASTIHPVLAVGPGWDWTTLIGLYASADTYTGQLRKLEQFTKANPKAADAYFLLAYHYMTCDHQEAAHKIFQKVVSLQPGDTVAAEYVRMTATTPTPDSSAGPTPEPPPAAAIPADKLLQTTDVLGKWNSTGGNGTTFTLELAEKGAFTWSFTQGKTSQSVKGVFALDQNKLAMEPDTGGTMLADLTKKGKGFHFDLEGAPENDPGLDFVK